MQTVTPRPESEQTSTFRPSPRLTAFVIGGLLAALVVGLVVLRSSRSGVLPNTTLAGVDVSGMDRAELTATVDRLAAERTGAMITVELGGRSRSATNATVGHRVDREATVERVWRRGRQVNPLAALSDHVGATVGATSFELVTSTDDEAVAAWARTQADALTVPPTEGTIRFDGADVRRRDPKAGQRLAPASLEAQARAAFAAPGDDTLDVQTADVAPQTTPADLDRLERRATRLVSAPVTWQRGDGTLELAPGQIGSLYRVRRSDGDDGPTFDLVVRRGRLRSLLDDEVRGRFEVAPRDADVVLTSSGPQVRSGRRGFRLNVAKTAESLDELARGEDAQARTGKMPGVRVDPDRTTKEARELRVTQKVSSFTTNHACCQGRVTNIHRFADIMDGALIEPGETFSLNGHVGPRTAAKGFVAGGAIQRGEYVDELGGGVSQFATTFFNAAYFGGYDIIEHKPHSYYISRYPVGRESTINYPTVDVKIRNDSPYGLLVDTSYSSTSITVTLWGRKWAEVSSSTGSPHNYTSPQTQYQDNADLAKGTERVIQSGGQGFDIVVTRRVNYLEGGSDTEEFFTRYLAEPRIIERGTAKKKS
jgi:vancomycin resistance protein YoaR